MQQNLGIYLSLLHDSLNIKQLLYMVSLSFEYTKLRISREQEQELNELKNYSSFFPKGKQVSPQMVKVIFLLVAHVDRVEVSQGLAKDQKHIVTTALKIINTVIESAFIMNHMPRGKKISVETFELLFDFSRSLLHAVPFQGPCSAMIEGISDNKFFSKCTSVAEIKELLESPRIKLSKEEIQVVRDKLNCFPQFEVEGSILVEGENDIRMGDICTVRVKITRNNARGQAEEAQGVASSSYLNFNKKEKIWAIVGDSKRTIFLKAFDSEIKVIEDSSIKFPIDKKLGFATGRQSLDIHVKSDLYRGVDSKITIDFTVLNPAKQN